MKNKYDVNKNILKYSIVLMLCICLMVVPLCTFGAQSYMTVTYNAEAQAVDITSSGYTSQGDAVIVHIASYSDSAALSDGNLPVLSDIFFAEDDGSLDVSFAIADDFENGKYIVYVGAAAFEKAVQNVILICLEDSEATAKALQKVNNAKTKTEFDKAVNSGGMDLGIDISSEKSFDTMLNVMYGVKQTWGKMSFDIFSKSVDFGRAAAAVQSGESIDSVMQKYAHVFSVTYSDYSSLDSSLKTAVADLLKTADYTNGFINWQELTAVATVKAADGYGSMRDYILANTDVLDIDTDGVYATLSVNNRSKVFKRVYDIRTGFKTAADVTSAFAAAADTVADQALQEASKSGSSSSGGSSGKTSFTAPTADVPVVSVPDDTLASTAPYSDIDGHFAQAEIEKLSADGIINGFEDGTFRPNEYVTRAQACKMIAFVFNLGQGGVSAFDDVDSGSWCYPYVSALSEKKIVLGDGNKFRPDDRITRQDAAVIVDRAMKFVEFACEGHYAFADSEDIAPYAAESVAALASNEYLKGDGISFMPQNNITRGEIAALLCRISAAVK